MKLLAFPLSRALLLSLFDPSDSFQKYKSSINPNNRRKIAATDRLLNRRKIYRVHTKHFIISRGGNLRGLGGRSPQSSRWGTAHAFVLPNILRSSVVGCARNYEKREEGVFLARKGS